MPSGTPLVHIAVEPEERRLSPVNGSPEFKTLCGQWRQFENLLGNYRPAGRGTPAGADNIEPTCSKCIKKRR